MDKRLRERRRQVNRERGGRRAGLIFVLVLAIVAVVAFLWLRSSSVFSVQQVTATVTQHVTEEQIAQAVSPARGISLLKLSTGEIEESLAALPYVRAIHVYRQFPDALEVRIEEYEPVARVRDRGGKVWLVADDGRVLERLAQQASSPLPLIVPATEFKAVAGGDLPRVVTGALPVALLLDGEDMASSLPEVGHISVSAGGDVVVHLEDGAELRLGEPTDLKQKMTVAAYLINKYLRDGTAVEYVDASAPLRPAVKPK